MVIHFISVQTNKDKISVSFDNGISWKEYAVSDNNVEDIEFSKIDCEDLDNIIIGTNACHRPYASETMKKYFNLETKNTIYTTPEDFGNLINTLSENDASNPYSIKIKGVAASNFQKIRSSLNNLTKNIYIDLSPTDFRECQGVFNNGPFFGNRQELLVDITLPDDLTYIGVSIFNGCINLKRVSIPNLVTDIGRQAFYNCSSLETVILTDGIRNIDAEVFDCDENHPQNLQKISYTGSYTKWLTVNIDPTNEFLNTNSVETTTFTVPLSGLEELLNNADNNSINNPVPVQIEGGVSTTAQLKELNTIIRNTEKYIDLASTSFKGLEDKFRFMDGDDSSSLIDTDIKHFITGFTVPDTVDYIGYFVFSNYTGLSTVIFGKGVTQIRQGAFTNCSNLSEVTIPSNVTSIGYNAFKGCNNIKLTCEYSGSFLSFFENTGLSKTNVYGITIPKTVTSIRDYEFEGCTNLCNVNMVNPVETVGKGAFKNCTSLKYMSFSTLRVVEDETFEGCSNLRSIYLAFDFINKIGNRAFYNCSNFTGIYWGETEEPHSQPMTPTDLSEIGEYAFYNTALEKVDMLGQLDSIPDGLFGECNKLTEITIPDDIQSVGNKAFYGCTNLTSVTLPSSLTSLGDYSFYDTGITSIDLPNSLVSIGKAAFRFTGLTEISLPDSLENIGEECFMENTNLRKVTFPKSIKYIDANAFNGCTSLTSLDLPSGLVEIGYRAFANCTSLTTVKLPETVSGWKQITDISENAGLDLNKITYLKCSNKINVWGSNGYGEINTDTNSYLFIPPSVTEIADEELKDFKELEVVFIPKGITRIGQNAFKNCENLYAVYIPKSVETIDFYAFNSCKNLEHVYYEGTEAEWKELATGWYPVQLYQNGIALKDEFDQLKTEIPSKKTHIKDGNDNLFNSKIDYNQNPHMYEGFPYQKLPRPNDYTFTRTKTYDIGSLLVDDTTSAIKIDRFSSSIEHSKTISDVVYCFGKEAFENCPNIEVTINYTADMADYFHDTGISKSSKLHISVNKDVTSIPDSMFSGYEGIQSIKFEEGINLQNIGSYAFADCTNLANLVVPETVTYIGEYAFRKCEKLESITLNEDTTVIRKGTFKDCIGLKKIEYPKSLETIETLAFYNCTSLEYIEFYDALKEIGENAFYNCKNVKLTCFYNEKYSDGSADWLEKSLYLGKSGLSTQNVYEITLSDTLQKIPNDEFINEAPECNYKNLRIVHFTEQTEIGDRAFAYCNFESVDLEKVETLTSIGDDAFYGCRNLEKLTFPSKLTHIGETAFAECESLKEVSIPDSVTELGAGVFELCTNLETVTLPKDLEKIPDLLFDGDTSLTEFNIPDTVTAIGHHAFTGCTSIGVLEIANNISSIEYEAFWGCYNVQLHCYLNSYWESIVAQKGFSKEQIYKIYVDTNRTEISDYLFEGYSSLNEVDFTKTGESNVSYIGYGAFKDCSSLATANLQSACKEIMDKAFMNNALTYIEIPTDIKKLNSSVFQECSKLVQVKFMGNEVGSLGDYVFKGCSSLTTINIPDSITEIGKGVFWGCSSLVSLHYPQDLKRLNDSMFYECLSLKSVQDLSSSNVTEFGNGAFYGCASLTSFIIPSNVTEIDNNCFAECIGLTNVVMSNEVNELGSNAFYNCKSLQSVTLSTEITEFRHGAFEKCSALKSITFPDGVTKVEGNVFAGCKSLVLNLGNNENFSLIYGGNGITSADGKTLYSCIDYTSSSIEIPATVVKIGNGAFKDCDRIQKLIVPDGVKYVDEYSFQDCTGITEISLPKSLNRIGNYAFLNCSNIVKTIFRGSQSKWNTVQKGTDGNSYLFNSIISYQD